MSTETTSKGPLLRNATGDVATRKHWRIIEASGHDHYSHYLLNETARVVVRLAGSDCGTDGRAAAPASPVLAFLRSTPYLLSTLCRLLDARGPGTTIPWDDIKDAVLNAHDTPLPGTRLTNRRRELIEGNGNTTHLVLPGTEWLVLEANYLIEVGIQVHIKTLDHVHLVLQLDEIQARFDTITTS